MNRYLVSVLLSLTLLAPVALLAAPAGAASFADDVSLAISPTSVDVLLGADFELQIDVTNNGAQATPPLVVHIDITDPEAPTSVDPEDWTSTLSTRVGVIQPGTTRTVTWRLQPISGGTFALYAVALTGGSDVTTVSNVVTVAVTDKRSINPDGILPVAVGAPVVVGGLLLSRVRRTRR